MATLLYSATMSVDGFIAGPGGDMSWLSAYAGSDPTAEALLDETGALLVGGRTWRGDDPNAGTDAAGAFGGAYTGPQVVLTRQPPAQPLDGVVFTDDLRTAIATAKALAGDRTVNILGAQTARACLETAELDEVLVFVVPLLLGDGVRLFDRPGGPGVLLERLRAGRSPTATSARYRVVR